MTIRFLAVMLSVVVTACATTDGRDSAEVAGDEDCFFTRSMSDWRALDDENLVVFAGRRNPYHLELAMSCTSLRSRDSIAFSDRDGRICSFGGDAVLIGGGFPQRCVIASIHGLTEEELDGLYIEYGIRAPAPPTPEGEIEVLDTED